MARVFSDMSAADPSFVDLVLLFLLPPLLEYACRLHRRGCRLHARFRCGGSSSFGGADGSAADHGQLACSCHRMFFRVEGEEDDDTARQISTGICRRSHPAISLEREDAADRLFGAPWNRRMAMFDRLTAYYTGQMRSTAALGRADRCTSWVCRREADGEIQLVTTREASRDNFNGREIIRTLRPYVEENTTNNRKRSTRNGHRRTMSDRLITDNDVELCTSTCPDDGRYRLPSASNGQYSRSNELVLRFCMNMARHDDELDRDYPLRISVDHGNYGYWSQRSLWFTLGDIDFDQLLSEQWSRRQCWGYSSGEILVQDVDSNDWREESCIDSTSTTVPELHDGSCFGKDSVCSDTDIDLHCNETLHDTVTTSTSPVNYVFPWSAGSGAGASSSTQLDGSSSDGDASSSTAEQPDGSCDDMDDRDDMDSSITTEELLVRQRDINEETDVSGAVAPEAPHNNDGTRSSTPWWLIPGFRFLPTDREIVLFYLKQKVLNLRLPAHHTVEEGHNVYALDADEITLHGINGDDERLGFFFVHKQDAYTYRNGCYYPTPDGYWRIRGRPVCVRRRGRTVAFKTAMDFYRGRPPHGCRTPWSMFEYALNACQADLRNFEQPWMNAYVVCKVRRRESKTSAAREKKRWRRPGLSPRRPLLKKISPRRLRPEMIVVPNADVAPKRMDEQVLAPGGGVDEEPGVTRKSKRSDMF